MIKQADESSLPSTFPSFLARPNGTGDVTTQHAIETRMLGIRVYCISVQYSECILIVNSEQYRLESSARNHCFTLPASNETPIEGQLVAGSDRWEALPHVTPALLPDRPPLFSRIAAGRTGVLLDRMRVYMSSPTVLPQGGENLDMLDCFCHDSTYTEKVL